MKYLLTLLLFLGTQAHAEDCQVSGISDSPQSINCNYHDGWYQKMRIEIRCVNGQYQYKELSHGVELESGAVVGTYHEEVSSGTSPLNFILKNQVVLRISKVFGLFNRGEFHMADKPPTGKYTFRCSVR